MDEMIGQGERDQRYAELHPKTKYPVGTVTDDRLLREDTPQVVHTPDLEEAADELRRQHPHQQSNGIGEEGFSSQPRVILSLVNLAELAADHPRDAAHMEKALHTGDAQIF